MSGRTTPRIKTRKMGQMPLKLQNGRKTEARTQFAALCWRFKKGKLQICIVTSRRSKRWILPKGWPMHNQTPAQAAATEAWEEAGVTGTAIDFNLGAYTYIKSIAPAEMPVIVMVYPVSAKEVHDKWPERKARKRKWLSPKKAAKKLTEPALRRIVTNFDPAKLPK